jgi:quinol-cytochrome oxidoreductase complex cytochrome b subunit
MTPVHIFNFLYLSMPVPDEEFKLNVEICSTLFTVKLLFKIVMVAGLLPCFYLFIYLFIYFFYSNTQVSLIFRIDHICQAYYPYYLIWLLSLLSNISVNRSYSSNVVKNNSEALEWNICFNRYKTCIDALYSPSSVVTIEASGCDITTIYPYPWS